MTNQYPPPYPPGGQQPYYGYPGPPNYGPPPDNNLVWAILATVLCCLPLGIVAIVKSSQVNSLWFQGLHAEAHKAADEAKKWAMWSAISVGILLLLYVIFVVVMLVVVGTSVKGFTP
ncbi:CD225/dispanin family protein [Amycolatopsis sp. NPDC059027]|uniref:CD225/dispanin family protein n=1 Tax=unclassified Amycolatopsis TaxID=2618356 RepID=UPI00366E8556